MTNQKNNQAQGFGLGLFVGMMSGIAAYYFFNTKQGGELKHKLVTEYHKTKADLPQHLSTIKESLQSSNNATLTNNLVAKSKEVLDTTKPKRTFTLKNP